MTAARTDKYRLDRMFRADPVRAAEVVAACRGQHLTPDAFWNIWKAIVDRADWYTFHLTATQAQLAREAPSTVAQVRRAMHVMRELGYLVQLTKATSPDYRNGKGRAARYRLILADLDLDNLAPSCAPTGTHDLADLAPSCAPTGAHEPSRSTSTSAPLARIGAPSGTPYLLSLSTDKAAPRRSGPPRPRLDSSDRRDAIATMARRHLRPSDRPTIADCTRRLDELAVDARTRWPDWLAYGNVDDLAIALACKIGGERISETTAARLDAAVDEHLGRHAVDIDDCADLDLDDDSDRAEIPDFLYERYPRRFQRATTADQSQPTTKGPA